MNAKEATASGMCRRVGWPDFVKGEALVEWEEKVEREKKG